MRGGNYEKLAMAGVVLAIAMAVFSIGITRYLAVHIPSSGAIERYGQINSGTAGLTGSLDDGDQFGSGVDAIGDLDDDGVTDLVVGAWKDDDGGTDFGAVYILFMNSDATIKDVQKISMTSGGFTGPIDSADDFGFGVSGIGDLNGDGIEDIAVSERANDNGGTDRGAFYVLFLNADGTVKAEQRVSDTAGGFTGTFSNFDVFGECTVAIPDVNGDGVRDLAVCIKQDDDGGTDRGSIGVLYMNTNGTVAGYHKINGLTGGFDGSVLSNSDRFGASMTLISDLNGDGIQEWAVGAPLDDDGVADSGAVYILFMNANGTVASQAKISNASANFIDVLHSADRFGAAVSDVGDLDNDGYSEILVGAWSDDAPATDTGAAYLIFLNAAGGVKKYQRYSGTHQALSGLLDTGDFFGISLSAIGDFNRDQVSELAIGAINDDTGGTNRGALWLLYLLTATGSNQGSVYPSNPSLAINESAACTATREVMLSLGARGASNVIISNDPLFIDAKVDDFIGPTVSYPWTLPDEDGQHTVYVVYRSSSDDLSTMQSASILLDRVNNCGLPVGEQPLPEDMLTEPCVPEAGEVYAPSPITGEVEIIEPVAPGEYIRGRHHDTVYYVDQDLRRRPFYDVPSFFTWQDTYARVRIVTDATLAQFPIGAPMLPRPGVVLIKTAEDPTVYFVTGQTSVRPLVSEEATRVIFGDHWTDYVIDVPTYILERFEVGEPVANATDILVDREIMKTRDELRGRGRPYSELNLWQKLLLKM